MKICLCVLAWTVFAGLGFAQGENDANHYVPIAGAKSLTVAEAQKVSNLLLKNHIPSLWNSNRGWSLLVYPKKAKRARELIAKAMKERRGFPHVSL